ncbi:MAG: hypothetical protein P3X24_008545 [bacterium]|nr:hypothetical protein [bacterium]
MPARVIINNHEWVRWSGGEIGKGVPQLTRGDVLAIAEKPGDPWRTPEIPELDGQIGNAPTVVDIYEFFYLPPEVAANRDLRYMAEVNPEKVVVLEYFEEPAWKPPRISSFDEHGNLVRVY